MAALGSQSIASSYEQLLHVDRDGGGDTTNHVSVKDGDNETTFGFTIASDALMMTSTNRLEFGDNGTYIHQSADGVLDLVSDTEIEINATTIDMNGAVDISGATQLNSTLTVGVDDTGYDVKFFGATATNGYMLWDESTDDLILGSASKLGIGATSPNATLDVRGNIYSEGATGIEFLDTGTAPYNPLTFKAIRSGGSAIQADEDLLEITAQGYDGGAYREMAGLKFAVDGTPGSGDAPGRIEFWATADGGTTFAEKMRISNAGQISNGNNVPATQAMSMFTSGAAVTTAEFQSTSSSQSATTAAVVYSKSDTSASANYNFYFCRSSGVNEAKWDGTGQLHGANGNVTSMDYAEYFESTDGSAIPVGTTVVLDGGKVKPSSSGETPIGVVRPYGTSSIVGGTAWNHWNKRWVTTDYDEVVFEDYEIYEWYDGEELKSCETDKVPEGVTIPDDAKTVSTDLHGNKLRRRKVNPDYDPDMEYKERKDRDEWNIVGLLGQVAITKEQPTASNWVKMKDVSDTVEMWFIK